MGDNGRRARAWPRREGLCGECKRWLVVRVTSAGYRLPRHICKDGFSVGFPIDVTKGRA